MPEVCTVSYGYSESNFIFNRMSQKLPQQKDISVQTDHDYGTAVCHNSNGDAAALCFNPYCSGQTMDQIAQVQMESVSYKVLCPLLVLLQFIIII
jgi:hypothetical protein